MLSRKAKKIHVRKLWRTLRNKIFSVTRVMSLLESVSTKIVFFGKNSKTIDKNKILRNKSTLQMFVIQPESKYTIVWRYFVSFLLLMNGIYTPFRVSFFTKPDSTFVLAYETITDVALFLDVIISFFTPYQRIDGSFELNNKKIARRYLYTWFLKDIVVILPTEFLMWEINYRASLFAVTREIRKQQMLRLLRLIKTPKIMKYWNHVTRKLKKKILEHISPIAMRIFIIVIFAIYMVHNLACLFYFAAKINFGKNNTWVQQSFDGRLENEGIVVRYFYALYWAFQTLTTVGYGDFAVTNTSEITVTLLWIFIGVIFYQFVVGAMTSYSHIKLDSSESLKNLQEGFNKFAAEVELKPEIAFQINCFMNDNAINMFSYHDELYIIESLPSTLKSEIVFHQYGTLIEKNKFFNTIQYGQMTSMVWGIVKYLILSSYTEDQNIYI